MVCPAGIWPIEICRSHGLIGLVGELDAILLLAEENNKKTSH